MKKILLLSFLLLIATPVMAESFSIDVDKIDINYKSNNLINKLDRDLKIDTKDFTKDKSDDKKAKEYTKKIINILFDDSDEIRRTHFLNEGYIVGNDGFGVLTSSYNLQAFYDQIVEERFKIDYIKYINVTKYDGGVVTTTYFPGVEVFGGKKDLILTLILRDVEGQYKVFAAYYTTGDDLLNKYNKTVEKENSGNFIGEANKSISVSGNATVPSENDLSTLYSARVDQVVSVSAMVNGAVGSYGSGFFIRKGAVVTTWSLFLKILNNCEFIYVNDAKGNAYKVDGVIAADVNYDLVILKVSAEVGVPVSFEDSKNLKTDDSVFMISSKINTGYSINYGSFVSLNKGVLKNQLVISESDIGSALFNKNGNVVGFNTGSVINSSISVANSTNYLIDIQQKLNNKQFGEIYSINVQEFKNKYYYHVNKEEKIDNVDNKVWKKYKDIGDIENTIPIDFVKRIYKDGILSIRYKNTIYGSLDSMFITMGFEEKLVNDGYKLTYNNNTKRIYENKKYRVIIKEDLDYVIVLLMEI